MFQQKRANMTSQNNFHKSFKEKDNLSSMCFNQYHRKVGQL